jgi:iron complex transport system ATP-binding protein
MGVSGSAALSVEMVSLRRGGTLVLDAIDLEVRHGEVLALIGPNGAGKSTLLAVMAGDLAPSTGTVHLAGREVRRYRSRELARRRSVMPQHPSVLFPFTVGEVIRMGREPWRGTDQASSDDRLVAEASAAAGVTHLLGREVTALSGGEQARVALARVLAQDTGVVLLDEPTASLDLRHQQEVARLVGQLAAENRAVVIVVHDLHLAAAVADRVALLDRGRLRAVGSPWEVLTAQLISEVYECEVSVLVDPDRSIPLVIAGVNP